MYHIKKDKRSQTSAKLICEGLTQCLLKKEFSCVTITDIQQASGIGRATFYRLFDNLTDVLAYQCDRACNEVLECFYSSKLSPKKTSILFIQAWMENYPLLDAILSCNRVDILHTTLYNRGAEIKQLFFPDLTVTDAQIDYYTGAVTSIMAGMIIMWVKRKKQETAEQVYLYFKCTIDLLGDLLN